MPHVLFSPTFTRDYRKLPLEIQTLVDKQIQRLALDPHHPSLRTHKRRGEGEIWQSRVNQSYRMFFSMSGDVIVIHHVGAHEK